MWIRQVSGEDVANQVLANVPVPRSTTCKTFFGRTNPGARPAPLPATPGRPVRWHPAPRSRNLATAVLLALLAMILTGHVALVPLARRPELIGCHG